MEALFLYILKVNALLAVFYILYIGLLERTTFYRENRFYFLFSIVISFGLPLMYITKTVWVAPIVPVDHAAQLTVSPSLHNETFPYVFYIFIIFLSTSILLIIKLLKNIYKTKALSVKYQALELNGIKYYDQAHIKTPFSFWDSIYFNSKNYSESELKVILLHEEIHIRQKHTLDLLLIQISCCIFWFNPFVWKLKSSIDKNLEYLTDQTVLDVMNEKSLYQKTLLKTMGFPMSNTLTHSFNQSFLKTRIMKINQSKTKKTEFWRFGLPLAAVLVFTVLFQIKTVAQVKQSNSYQQTDTLGPPMPPTPPTPPTPPMPPSPPISPALPTIPPTPPTPPVEPTTTLGVQKNNSTIYKNKKSAIYTITAEPLEANPDFIQLDPHSTAGKKIIADREKAIAESKIAMQESKIAIMESKRALEKGKKAVEESKKAILESRKAIEEQRKMAIEAAELAMNALKNSVPSRAAAIKESEKLRELAMNEHLAAIKEARIAIDAHKSTMEQLKKDRKIAMKERLALIQQHLAQ